MSSKIISIAVMLLMTSASVFGQVNCPANLPLTMMGNTDYCIGSVGAEVSVNETYAGYEWLPTTQTTQSALLTAGNYQVVVTHYTGCTDTLEFEVNQVSNPPQPTIDLNGPAQFCHGESVVLSVPTWYPYYEWSSGSISDEITVFESGTYIVSVEDWIGCASSSNSVQITVDPLPTAAFSPNLDLFDIEFNNLSYDATDYEWNFGDGTISTDFEPTHTYLTGGATPMYLVAFNNCGSDTAFLNLESVGITEHFGSAKFQLYPNPATDYLILEMSGNTRIPADVRIFNGAGQLVVHDKKILNNGSGKVAVNHLSTGLYLLQLRTESSIHSKTFFIER